jgi:hypothetical protein
VIAGSGSPQATFVLFYVSFTPAIGVIIIMSPSTNPPGLYPGLSIVSKTPGFECESTKGVEQR